MRSVSAHKARPLSARSVLLSILLGFHPPELPVSTLVRLGELFGIGEGAIRVALVRMVADGDVESSNKSYRLTGPLLDRQRRMDESCAPRTKAWRGSWEMAVVTSAARPLADRVALRRTMAENRLAELREGVWLRPANLIRPRPAITVEQCTSFTTRLEDEDPVALARSLWNLDELAAEAQRLHDEIVRGPDLVEGLLVGTQSFHHLQQDPVLPPELLPADWPGVKLRERLAEFVVSYSRSLREYGQE
jgi:phenylacetic acid degradation operon negative regulatory protein